MKIKRNFGDGMPKGSAMPSEDHDALFRINRNAKAISKKYKIPEENVFALSQEKSRGIPLRVLLSGLAPLEAAVLYLKDEAGFSINEISRMLGRKYKNIWATYSKAKKAKAKKGNSKSEGKCFMIPVNAFSNPNLGILESAVVFLREKSGIQYKKIAEMTGRDERTIWTAYKKAKEKERIFLK